ncbi:helix-turn-helix transcriptional regulator [Roseivivax sediminis]|uniref:DNA-binding transcriptional regulator, CsgD family n=1 Tax=Roseivivax sediminis TaxID=936889 RepID=A0A1I2DE87_9RHOB|nr:LuxR C-terminal-related transcriptional regulator [Roseivivax sediminis]SFE78473.1 DNA-binding transcriptional regulator, CsgD family [Roseivivax sediminis]
MVVYDRVEPDDPSPLPHMLSFASYAQRHDLGTQSNGSVRLTHLGDFAASPVHLQAMKVRGLESVIDLMLRSDDESIDFLEIGFAYPVTETQAAAIEAIGMHLAGTWLRRVPSIFAANLKLVEQRASSRRQLLDPLSFENPYNLTRMEHTVARLVAEGETRARILEKLKIGKSTLTRHLIGIYAKVGVSSLRELSRRLDADGK